MNYTQSVNVINSFSIIGNGFSMSPADFRFIPEPHTFKKLVKLINKVNTGYEIGSESYIKKSNLRFIKTNNISNSFLLDNSRIEYCIPSSKAIEPSDSSLFLVKDGGTGGLGEVILYKQEEGFKDYISGGIIELKINNEKLKFYILGVLKSNHFKEYIDNVTPGGSTIRHSKLLALNYNVPFPEQSEVQELVSLITQNIIDKEQQIREKNKKINSLIHEELKTHSNIHINYPNSYEIIQSNFRFDTGLYSNEYKSIKLAIETYEHGYFQLLDLGDLKSGSTPKERVIRDKRYNNLLRQWITPTVISNFGTLKRYEFIFNRDKRYNLNKNSLLFINRGNQNDLAINYLYKHTQESQHNQGLYRLEFNEITEKILFVSCIYNSDIYRKYIGLQGLGSKMFEIKKEQLENTLIPNFPKALQKEIAKEYFNEVEENKDLSLENYLEKEKQRNSKLGIWQLNMEVFELKEKLEKIISDIVYAEEIQISDYL